MRRFGESVVHEKAKQKVANALRDKGFTVHIDSYPFECQTEKGERTYWPDVFATNANGKRRIILEVAGFKGHKSKAAFQADRLRIQDIRNSFGQDIEYYTVHLNRRIGPLDIRSWSVEDICEHLNLK